MGSISKKTSIRVVVGDGHRLARDGLCALLGAQPGVEVIARAGDGRSTVRLARELAPAVVILDLAMPDVSGIEATRQIKDLAPGVKVLVLSTRYQRRLITEAFRAGASGYLLKDCATFKELYRAVSSVIAGKTYVSPRLWSQALLAKAGRYVPDTLPGGQFPSPLIEEA